MPNPAETANNTNYVDFQEYVDFQLRKARQQIRMTDVLTAGTMAAVLLVGYLLVFVIADQWLFSNGVPSVIRWIGITFWGTVLAVWISFRLAIPLLRSVTGLFAAKEVERSEPELRSNLLNWVDLQAAGRTVDPAVLRAIERRAAVQLSKIDVSQAIDHRPLLRSGYVLLGVVLLFCIYALFSPKQIAPSLARVIPFTEVAAPTKTEIREVKPGDTHVLAGSTPEITVDLAGVIPEKVTLLYTTADRKFRDEPVILQPDGAAGTRFRTLLVGESGRGVRQDLVFHITAGDATSREYRVTVDIPPSVRVNEVSMSPPEYTKLPKETVAGGNISGWEGTTVSLRGEANMPVKSAVIQFLDEPQGQPTGEEVAAVVQNDREISATWPLEFRTDGTFAHHYRVQCRTEDGREDPEPLVYEISIRRDQPPEIVLLAPERDLEVPANAVIPLLVEARDPDFELGPVTLEVQQAGKTIGRETLSQGQQPAVRLQHDLALKPFALQPGDEVTFWLAAQDNRQPRRNRKQTPPLKIKITAPVTEQQARDLLAEEKSRQQEQLAELDQNMQQSDMTEQPKTDDGREDGVREQPQEPMAGDMPAGEQPPNADPQEGGQAAQGGNSTSSNNDSASETPASQSSGDQKSNSKEDDSLSSNGEDDQQVLERLIQKLQSKQASEDSKPGDSGKSPPGKQKEPSNSDSQANQTDGDPQKNSAENVAKNNGKNAAQNPKTADGQPSEPGDNGSTNGNKPQRERTDGPSSAQPEDMGNNKPMPNGKNGDQSPADGMPDPSQQPDKPNPSAPKNNTQPDTTNSKQPDKPSQGAQGKDQPSADMNQGEGQPNQPGESPSTPPSQNNAGSKDSNNGKMPDPMGKNPSLPQEKSPSDSAASKTQEMTDSGKPDGGNQPESAADASSSKPKETEAGGTGAKPTTPKDANPPSGNPGDMPQTSADMPNKDASDSPTGGKESRDGAPNAANETPKGNGRKDGQRSDQPQTGENGGSAQSQEGSSGSRQRGPGESTGKPGEQESGSSPNPSGKSGPSKSGSQSKPGQGQKSGSQDSNSSTGSGDSSSSPMPGSKSEGGMDASSTGGKSQETMPSDGMPNSDNQSPDSGKSSNGKKTVGGSSGQPQSKDSASSGKDAGDSTPQQASSKSNSDEMKSGGEKGNESDSQGAGSSAGKDMPSEQGAGQSRGDSAQGQDSAGDQSSGGQSSGGKPSQGQSGNAGSGSAGESGAGGSRSGNPGNSPVGQGGSAGGNAGNVSGAGTDSADGPQPGNQGDNPTGTAAPAGDAANLEYKKQAAELVLQRLKQGLERGDVDQQLLDDLGWTPDQLKQFVNRLDAALKASQSAPESPVEQARREQFEEMLKTLDLDRAGTKRTGAGQPVREVEETNSRRTPVPLEYRQAWEKYTKSLSKSAKPAAK